MALFSRRKKSEAEASDIAEATPDAADGPTAQETDAPAQHQEPAPAVNISVQAFRGVGAQAGPQVALEDDAAPAQNQNQAPEAPQPDRPLPLAPVAPPAQNHTSKAVPDNVLLREALARLGETPTNEQLLGVLRQMLQGHLLLRVHGNVQEQLAAGTGLRIGLLRDGERTFLLAFSSAAAVSKVIQADGSDPKESSVVAQPVAEVLKQVVDNDFTGLVLDSASAPHRAVFPTDLIKKSLEQADPAMAVKSVLAVPQPAPGAEPVVAEKLATTRMWVAAGQQPDGQVGIAEMQGQDGRRFLQLFTHPLEVIAMGRDERPLPFTPEQLGKTLQSNPGLTGVLIDPAGPSLVVRREALDGVIALADA